RATSLGDPLISLLRFLLRPPPTPTLFPYTTLFRSKPIPNHDRPDADFPNIVRHCQLALDLGELVGGQHPLEVAGGADAAFDEGRSEEHTSELQSRENLVCRLLLEKKTTWAPDWAMR